VWWARPDPINVFLGQACAAIRLSGGAVTWSTTDSPAAGWRWVAEVLATSASIRARRSSIQVWLSGALARPFILPKLPGARDVGEAENIGAHLAAEQTGQTESCCVCLDGWTKDAPCLATAMSRSLHDLLLLPRGKTNPPVCAIRPWWSAGLNAIISCADAPNLIGLRDEESLTVLGGRGDSFELAGSFAAMDTMASRQLLARLTVAHSALDRVAVFSTDLEPGTTARHDSQWVLKAPFAVFKEPAL
jgi:hypothetical protein